MKRFLPYEDDYIRLNYLQQSLNEMGEAIGRSFGSIRGRMKVLGLTVPASILAERHAKSFQTLAQSGKITRYAKGHVPFNKGQKPSPETLEKMRPTMFKKGQKPLNCIHNGQPYLYTRRRSNGYEEKLWFIQEGINKRSAYLAYLCRQNGIDLTGKKPRLKPGFDHSKPPTMADIVIVTEAENMLQNSYINLPADVIGLVKAKALLTKHINKIQNI